jgi:PTS hybrid protein
VSAEKVGVVYVSHSAKIAAGLVELAAQMAPATSLVAAGGTEDNGLGTSFERVSSAIHTADAGAGVVVLCDLGSAILTAETALDFLDEALRARVRILDAPLIEGGVAAAVAAEIGGDLATVASAAEAVTFGSTQSGAPTDALPVETPRPTVSGVARPEAVTRTVTLTNADGLHARPAADFVRLASTFSAQISVNEVDATSLLGIMGLGLTIGMHASISAIGPDAQAAVAALTTLIESGFGE